MPIKVNRSALVVAAVPRGRSNEVKECADALMDTDEDAAVRLQYRRTAEGALAGAQVIQRLSSLALAYNNPTHLLRLGLPYLDFLIFRTGVCYETG